MRDFLKTIAENSRFELEIYNGALTVQGRILSPQESEALGLTSGMIAAQLFPGKAKAKLGDLSKLKDVENLEEEDWSEMVEMMKQIKPESLLQFSQHQDRIINKCIKKGSTDKGETWGDLTLVLTEAEQDPDKDRLWIGLLTPEDRKAIVEAAMKGHKEAADRLQTFR